jgi:23S rRNA (guanine1835-N2)-methyltransferase
VPDVFCPTPFGTMELHRLPLDRSGTLQAWDGADLLLLEQFAGRGLPTSARVLVVGDNFGALAISLMSGSHSNVVLALDSMVASRAVAANLRRNTVDRNAKVGLVEAVELAEVADGSIDVVIWNVDRVTDLVADIAANLSRISHSSTVVFAAGMDKNLPPRTGEILRSIGEVTTHPGRRKAHLFEVVVPSGMDSFRPIVAEEMVPVAIAEHGIEIRATPGVFSADRFDVGTRLLADPIAALEPQDLDIADVVDLGCGAGTLGIVALRRLRDARVTFIDESARALACARSNVIANCGTEGDARSSFVHSDVWSGVEVVDEFDLVVCNPPFHHANAMTDEVAWQMFLQSHARIRPGGELWVVGNRHLGYHDKLQRIFGNVRHMSPHPKFVVLAATR